MDRRALLRGLAAAALSPALGACAARYPALRLTIATGGTNGVYFMLGTALASVWQDAMGTVVAPTVRATAGSGESLALLASRDADVAFSQIDTAAQDDARTARTDPASPRALARLYDEAVHVVVPRDSPLTSITQLRGRRVSVNVAASGVYPLAQAILLAIRLPVTPVQLNLDDSAAALRAGRIDAFIWSGGLPTDGVTRLNGEFPIRLLDLADVEKPIRAAELLYTPGTVPAGTYGSTAPITTFFVRNVLLVRAEMPDDIAQALVGALFAQQARLARVSRAASTVDPRSGIDTEPIALHPGAMRWYQEARDS